MTHELEGAPMLAELIAGELEDRGRRRRLGRSCSASLKTLLETGESFTH